MSKPTIVLALLSAVLLAFTARSDVAEGTYTPVGTIVGVDAITTGNTATSLGTIDRCVSVSPNATFYIDLFVKDVTNLNYWSGTLRFDGSRLQVTSINVDYFLKTTPGSVVYNGSDNVPSSSGAFVAGATDQEYLPESGSGVLARVGLKALAAGTSRMYFTWPVSASGVYLEDHTANPIGDINGDAMFDGLVFNAIAVIGGPCPLDADLDGFNDVEESIDVSDLLVAGSSPEMCDGVDNDLDSLIDEGYDRAPVNGVPDCVDPASNTDGDGSFNPTDTDDDNDGYTDARETYLATDTLADCPMSVYHSAWPRDINNDGVVTVPGDVLKYSGIIGATIGQEQFRKRLDLNGDHAITVPGDVIQFAGHIGQTCS
jgi:hypothetical protein